MSKAQNNTLTQQEKEEGWSLLFDGSTSKGWRGYNMDHFPENRWKIEDGTLVLHPDVANGEPSGADIITIKKYNNFELKLEWKISKGGNSGILYMGLEQPGQPVYWSAPEMQVLDNENHPDAKAGKNGNRKSGSLYDLIPAKPQNAKPYGEWNQVKIVKDGSHVEHWQNGVKVVEYELWTPEWYEMVRNSKFVGHPAFGDIHEGVIALQDHGNVVSYRNIKIKELK